MHCQPLKMSSSIVQGCEACSKLGRCDNVFRQAEAELSEGNINVLQGNKGMGRKQWRFCVQEVLHNTFLFPNGGQPPEAPLYT